MCKEQKKINPKTSKLNSKTFLIANVGLKWKIFNLKEFRIMHCGMNGFKCISIGKNLSIFSTLTLKGLGINAR